MAENIFHTNEDLKFAPKMFQMKMFKIKSGYKTPLEYTMQNHSSA